MNHICHYCKQPMPGTHTKGCAQENLRSVWCEREDGNHVLKEWPHTYVQQSQPHKDAYLSNDDGKSWTKLA